RRRNSLSCQGLNRRLGTTLVSGHDPLLEKFGQKGKAAGGGNFLPPSQAAYLDQVALPDARSNPSHFKTLVGPPDQDEAGGTVRLKGLAGDHKGVRLFANVDAADAEVVGAEPAVGVVEFGMDLDAPSLLIHFRADMTHLGKNQIPRTKFQESFWCSWFLVLG